MLMQPGLRLHDISVDGRVLLSRESWCDQMIGLFPGDSRTSLFLARQYESDRYLRRWAFPHLYESGEVWSIDGDSLTYYRRTDGSAAVRLGTGQATLSPDGKSFLISNAKDRKLLLQPVGPGDSKEMPTPRTCRLRPRRLVRRRTPDRLRGTGREPRLERLHPARGQRTPDPDQVRRPQYISGSLARGRNGGVEAAERRNLAVSREWQAAGERGGSARLRVPDPFREWREIVAGRTADRPRTRRYAGGTGHRPSNAVETAHHGRPLRPVPGGDARSQVLRIRGPAGFIAPVSRRQFAVKRG